MFADAKSPPENLSSGLRDFAARARSIQQFLASRALAIVSVDGVGQPLAWAFACQAIDELRDCFSECRRSVLARGTTRLPATMKEELLSEPSSIGHFMADVLSPWNAEHSRVQGGRGEAGSAWALPFLAISSGSSTEIFDTGAKGVFVTFRDSRKTMRCFPIFEGAPSGWFATWTTGEVTLPTTNQVVEMLVRGKRSASFVQKSFPLASSIRVTATSATADIHVWLFWSLIGGGWGR